MTVTVNERCCIKYMLYWADFITFDDHCTFRVSEVTRVFPYSLLSLNTVPNMFFLLPMLLF